MAVTLKDLVAETTDYLYSMVQLKDKFVYLDSDISDSDTTITFASATDARQVQVGMILQFGTDDSVVTELARVTGVDPGNSQCTVRRGVLGSTAAAWSAASCEIQVNPEYLRQTIIREINNTISSFPPDIWSYDTQTTTVHTEYLDGYVLPADAVGVVSVLWAPVGLDDNWQKVRRWKFDPQTKTLQVFQYMEPSQALKIVYRQYPSALVVDGSTLEGTAHLTDSCRDLIVLGALHKLLLSRASGRLVDDRAETLSNASQRTADPVMGAVRQVYALFQQRLMAERERQRLQYPVQIHTTF
jgi:hypothetical protein